MKTLKAKMRRRLGAGSKIRELLAQPGLGWCFGVPRRRLLACSSRSQPAPCRPHRSAPAYFDSAAGQAVRTRRGDLCWTTLACVCACVCVFIYVVLFSQSSERLVFCERNRIRGTGTSSPFRQPNPSSLSNHRPCTSRPQCGPSLAVRELFSTSGQQQFDLFFLVCGP